MKKIIIILLLFASTACLKTNHAPKPGGIYSAKMDFRAQGALNYFVKTKNIKIKKVLDFKQQVIAGMNYFFVLKDTNGKKISVTIYQDLQGEYHLKS